MSNPFKILGVDNRVEKRQILQRAMAVLQQKSSYDARTIAEAQKTLFSPLSRAQAEFIHCLDWDIIAMAEVTTVPGEEAAPELTLLDMFDAEGKT